MDNVTLKKKLSSYVTEGGYLKNLSEELIYEVLVAWENWTGKSSDFYKSLGFTHAQMASVIGKAKKLKRDGHFGEGDFKQIRIDAVATEVSNHFGCQVELVWPDGKLIRFAQVDLLAKMVWMERPCSI